jgi:hypothetical protein
VQDLTSTQSRQHPELLLEQEKCRSVSWEGFFESGGVGGSEREPQKEELVWRYLPSRGERQVFGYMVTCRTPPRRVVGESRRGASQVAQCMGTPKGVGTRGEEGHILGR